MEILDRYVVVSSNNNPDYLFFAPFIERAWNKLGWKLCIMVTHDVDVKLLKNRLNNDSTIIYQVPEIEVLRTETVAQASRLYAANILPLASLIMTSDMDLLPLKKDYWNPSINDITVYGHDLTWFSYYPMGYTAMSGFKWKEKLNCTYNTAHDIERDCKELKIAYSPDWEQWWNHDWQLLTNRLKPFESEIKFINRGQTNIAGTTLALGRVDRYNWQETLKQSELIDAHCENNNVKHPVKLEPFLELFNKYYSFYE